MTWRTVQLDNRLCDQDQLILDLFQGQSVRYIGNDLEFAQHLPHDDSSRNLILTINRAVWTSDILKQCQQYLTPDIEQVYLSVNRYCVLGNDTNITANDVQDLLVKILNQQGFTVLNTGKIERDLGRRFNFVQPLTWAHANRITN